MKNTPLYSLTIIMLLDKVIYNTVLKLLFLAIKTIYNLYKFTHSENKSGTNRNFFGHYFNFYQVFSNNFVVHLMC